MNLDLPAPAHRRNIPLGGAVVALVAALFRLLAG